MPKKPFSHILAAVMVFAVFGAMLLSAFAGAAGGSVRDQVYEETEDTVSSAAYRSVDYAAQLALLEFETELFYEDFESYAENAYPGTFTLQYNGSGTANQKVISTDTFDGSTGKVFQLQGVSSWASEQYVSLPASVPEKLVIDAYIKPVTTTRNAEIALRNLGVGSWGTRISSVWFEGDGTIVAVRNGNDDDRVVIGSYTVGSWYRVTLDNNITAKTYDVYIDGFLAASDIPMHPSVAPAELSLIAHNVGFSTAYFDNVGMYTELPEFAREFDIENSRGTGSGWSFAGSTLTITEDGDIRVYGTGASTANKIVVNTGVTANIVLDNVNINVSGASNACALDIQGTAVVNVDLAEGSENTLRSGEYMAGLQVADGAVVNIGTAVSGSGSLNAFGGAYASGIGGAYDHSGGEIVINDGNINATGGYGGGSGIGGGLNADGCDITINEGIVNAYGTDQGAGIGSGYYGDVGRIIIHGGTINASSTGNEGSYYGGSGIGSGDDGYNGEILIDGGTITASGKYDCPGIGGCYGSTGTITIRGAGTTVTASSGLYAAAIGGGYGDGGGVINIEGGTITANGRYRSPGIGDYDDGTTVITISEGTVISNGGTEACGIGSGYHSEYNPLPRINFNGGSLAVSHGASASYDINANLRTTLEELFAQGGTLAPSAGQVISLSGEATGIFYYDRNGAAADDTVITAVIASPDGYFVLDPPEYHMQIVRQADDLSWKYAVDGAQPALFGVGVVRTSDSEADVTVRSEEFAQYFYEVTENDAATPTINTGGAGIFCDGEATLHLDSLTAGAWDIFMAAKDMAGNVGPMIKMDIDAYDTPIGNQAPVLSSDWSYSTVYFGQNYPFNVSVTDYENTPNTKLYSYIDSAAPSQAYNFAVVPGTVNITLSPLEGVLSAGSHTLNYYATDTGGATSETLVLNFTVASGLSDNASLSGISIPGIELTPAFDSETTSYTASVGNSVNSAAITAEPSDDAAAVTINGAAGTTGEVPLNVGSNVITVEVTAADGVTTKTYTITIRRAARSSSGGGSSYRPPVVTVETGTIGLFTLNSITFEPDVSSGIASVSITKKMADALLDKAKETGGTSDGDMIEVILDTGAGIEGIRLSITQSELARIASDTDAGFGISSLFIKIVFDGKAVETISGADSSGEVVISANRIADRDGRPVYDLAVMNGDTPVPDFNGGHATVTIPYALQDGENPNAVVIYSLVESGALETVMGQYDAELKAVVFKTTFFSKFVIGYNPVTFTDVAPGAWYKNAVDFIAARGITAGIDENKFGPEENITRAQFVVLLMNAFQISAQNMDGYEHIQNFADAGNTYYTGYLQAAKGMGIVNGVGGNMFAPENEITRQEMFVILYNALKAIDELPSGANGADLSAFNDAGQVAGWAHEAAAALSKAGIVEGDSSSLYPTATTTRAEFAQVLYNILTR